jgi:DNA-binding MarR family transcriptional regulator
MTKDIDDLLRRAAAAQRHAMERTLAPAEITPTQFAMMEWLDQEPGLSGTELTKRERLTPPTTSVVVSNLERKQLLLRRARAEGGRAQHLELTPAGRRRVEAAAEAVAGARNRLSADLDPGFEKALKTWLLRVADLDV